MLSVENFHRNTFSFGPGLFCFVYRELASGGSAAKVGGVGTFWSSWSHLATDSIGQIITYGKNGR
jgi:hypothetical protein